MDDRESQGTGEEATHADSDGFRDAIASALREVQATTQLPHSISDSLGDRETLVDAECTKIANALGKRLQVVKVTQSSTRARSATGRHPPTDWRTLENYSFPDGQYHVNTRPVINNALLVLKARGYSQRLTNGTTPPMTIQQGAEFAHQLRTLFETEGPAQAYLGHIIQDLVITEEALLDYDGNRRDRAEGRVGPRVKGLITNDEQADFVRHARAYRARQVADYLGLQPVTERAALIEQKHIAAIDALWIEAHDAAVADVLDKHSLRSTMEAAPQQVWGKQINAAGKAYLEAHPISDTGGTIQFFRSHPDFKVTEDLQLTGSASHHPLIIESAAILQQLGYDHLQDPSRALPGPGNAIVNRVDQVASGVVLSESFNKNKLVSDAQTLKVLNCMLPSERKALFNEFCTTDFGTTRPSSAINPYLPYIAAMYSIGREYAEICGVTLGDSELSKRAARNTSIVEDRIQRGLV